MTKANSEPSNKNSSGDSDDIHQREYEDPLVELARIVSSSSPLFPVEARKSTPLSGEKTDSPSLDNFAENSEFPAIRHLDSSNLTNVDEEADDIALPELASLHVQAKPTVTHSEYVEHPSNEAHSAPPQSEINQIPNPSTPANAEPHESRSDGQFHDAENVNESSLEIERHLAQKLAGHLAKIDATGGAWHQKVNQSENAQRPSVQPGILPTNSNDEVSHADTDFSEANSDLEASSNNQAGIQSSALEVKNEDYNKASEITSHNYPPIFDPLSVKDEIISNTDPIISRDEQKFQDSIRDLSNITMNIEQSTQEELANIEPVTSAPPETIPNDPNGPMSIEPELGAAIGIAAQSETSQYFSPGMYNRQSDARDGQGLATLEQDISESYFKRRIAGITFVILFIAGMMGAGYWISLQFEYGWQDSEPPKVVGPTDKPYKIIPEAETAAVSGEKNDETVFGSTDENIALETSIKQQPEISIVNPPADGSLSIALETATVEGDSGTNGDNSSQFPSAAPPIGPNTVRTVVIQPSEGVIAKQPKDAQRVSEVIQQSGEAIDLSLAGRNDEATVAGLIAETPPEKNGETVVIDLDQSNSTLPAIGTNNTTVPSLQTEQQLPAFGSNEISIPTPQKSASVLASLDRIGSSAGTHLVQMSSQRSEASAKTTLDALIRRHNDLLSGHIGYILSVDLGDRGIFFRVGVGPLGGDEASNLCADLKRSGTDCFVMRKPQ